ncbi:MAG: phosphopantothenate/pantothenate synthetase [archaeon]
MVKETEISLNHPRAKSLKTRHNLVSHVESGVVTLAGVLAHGRGEAFDYLLGEKTTQTAYDAIKTAAAVMLLAKHPVISVNGNIAALVPEGIIKLAEVTGAKIEVNLFHRTLTREESIKQLLEQHGATEVLGVGDACSAEIPEICSERRNVDPNGILVADVILVPLEDGDRTEALRKMGKTVITVDLNPLSRTAQWANVTIVDEVARSFPLLIKEAKLLKSESPENLRRIVSNFDNKKNLTTTIGQINQRLSNLAKQGVYIPEANELYKEHET